jgi:hypothetical protein
MRTGCKVWCSCGIELRLCPFTVYQFAYFCLRMFNSWPHEMSMWVTIDKRLISEIGYCSLGDYVLSFWIWCHVFWQTHTTLYGVTPQNADSFLHSHCHTNLKFCLLLFYYSFFFVCFQKCWFAKNCIVVITLNYIIPVF